MEFTMLCYDVDVFSSVRGRTTGADGLQTESRYMDLGQGRDSDDSHVCIVAY